MHSCQQLKNRNLLKATRRFLPPGKYAQRGRYGQAEYILRDHSTEKFAERQVWMQRAADFINARYGAGTLVLDVKESYLNMRSMIEPHPYIIETALEAYRLAGVELFIVPVRGMGQMER